MTRIPSIIILIHHYLETPHKTGWLFDPTLFSPMAFPLETLALELLQFNDKEHQTRGRALFTDVWSTSHHNRRFLSKP